MKKSEFYFLSFTWGALLTLAGLLVAAVLLCLGHRPKKYGPCLCFEIGRGWGGFNLGVVFLTAKGASGATKKHELGHAIQNCKYGIFAIFAVFLPSVIRYWYRELTKNNKTPYDAVWFEKQATEWGTKTIEEWGE